MRLGLLALLALTVCGCGEDSEENTLGGSVDRIYPLSFNETRARTTSRELAIQYVDTSLVPVQVVIDLESEGFNGRGDYALETIGQVVGSREGTELPAFIDGQITFTSFGTESGADIAGDFAARVGDEEKNYTVFGTFKADLEVLD